jgi:hypothetical protein
MSNSSRRRNVVIIVLAILLLLLLLLVRCGRKPPVVPPADTPPATASTLPTPAPITTASSAVEPADLLTSATIEVPPQVHAGAKFMAKWTGPDNKSDYLSVVKKSSTDGVYANYAKVHTVNPVELLAPMEPGEWEVRYMTRHSDQILGRATVVVTPVEAALNAADEIVLGSPLSVTWTGPNNAGDYITLVLKETPDGASGNFVYTTKNSPLSVTAPVTPGEAELRYMTGQGDKVLARRPVRIVTPQVTLSADPETIAGSTARITWSGPNNAGDYVTIVSAGAKDGEHDNYTYTAQGSPMSLLIPIMSGDAELRYMTGQGGKVLQRRRIRIVMPGVTLTSPAEAAAASAVDVSWTGPDYGGDYITIVPSGAKEGTYADYTLAHTGTTLKVKAPKEPGSAEVRYMSGQGGKVLQRRPIQIK